MDRNGKSMGVQVIARAADVLRALEVEPGGLSLAKIAQRVELPRSTVHRIVTPLEAESLVVPASPSGGYRLGPELARFAASAGGELRESVRPAIERLRYEADETVDLAVLNRDRVFFIDQVTAPHRLQTLSAVRVSLPAHCTAIGKALLAGLTDEQVERLLPKRLPAETANTITDRDELLADLARVRAIGVAYDREELTIGISAVGAEIRDASGGVAALSIPVPTARFGGQEEYLAEMLLRTCAEISATHCAHGHLGSWTFALDVCWGTALGENVTRPAVAPSRHTGGLRCRAASQSSTGCWSKTRVLPLDRRPATPATTPKTCSSGFFHLWATSSAPQTI